MVINFIHRCVSGALDTILPLKCMGCGKNEAYLCEKCKENLLSVNAPICSNIKETNSVRNYTQEFMDATTSAAKQQNSISNGIKVFSALQYKNPLVKKLIWHLKYRNKRKIGELLADIIIVKLKLLKNSSDKIIIPIPISKKRLRQRGYNQTVLIAKNLSSKTGIPLFQNILAKKFNTSSQVETKTKSERIKNLKNSFEVNYNFKNDLKVRLPDYFKNKTVLLLDDVITTGTTLNEAAKTLKLAGFKKIIGITAAKG